jgi:molecular chaperone DnaK
MQWVLEKFKAENGIDLREEPIALQRIRESAEKAKCDLSMATSAEINLPFITKKEGTPLNLAYSLPRAEFETMVAPLLERSMEPCKKALRDANLTPNDLTDVILVGGMTRMPKVRETVKKFFNREPNTKINPDESVAMGAAIQAGIINGSVRNALLLDVTPLSLGVETLGGTFSVIIPRNTTVPTKMSKLYSTVKDMQTSVNVKVLQGESKLAGNNKTLGFFSFIGLPPATAGTVQIEVTFSIDSNGIVNVAAKNVATGQIQQMKVSATSGLSKDELEALVQNAKGRVISTAPPPAAKAAKETGSKKAEPAEAGSADPAPVAPSGEGEFLTGDMINSFLKDPDDQHRR